MQHFLYVIFFFPSLIFLLIVYIFKDKIKIRWYCLISTRIGHFISEPIIYFSSKKKKMKKLSYILGQLYVMSIFSKY